LLLDETSLAESQISKNIKKTCCTQNVIDSTPNEGYESTIHGDA